jgi:hypothetical protein
MKKWWTVRHLKRLPAAAGVDQIAGDLKALRRDYGLNNPQRFDAVIADLSANAGGVSLQQEFKRVLAGTGLRMQWVTVTDASSSGAGDRISRNELMAHLRIVGKRGDTGERGDLRISDSLPLAGELEGQMDRLDIADRWRATDADDLVSAVALALLEADQPPSQVGWH